MPFTMPRMHPFHDEPETLRPEPRRPFSFGFRTPEPPPPHHPRPERHPHPGRHPHPPHHGPAGERQGILARYLCELRWMGAANDDLHAVVDEYLRGLSDPDLLRRLAAADPGRMRDGERLHPLARARAIDEAARAAQREWFASLAGRTVLIVGEFPPHLLEELLLEGVEVVQIHPPDPEGGLPPHFMHLARYGLRGVTDLHELAAFRGDVLLVHGAAVRSQVYVSPLVPVVLRMFPGAEVRLCEADHVAPHMLFAIADPGFARVPAVR